MTKIKIRTIHDVIRAHNAKRILAVTQRVDADLEYEDGQKVANPKLRTQEAIFQASLDGEGVHLEIILGDKFDNSPKGAIENKNYGLVVLMGEVISQSLSRAKKLSDFSELVPVYVEITKDTVQSPRDLKAVEARAKA